MIGEKFGRLVVLKKTDKRNSSRAIILLCKCECGNEYLAPSTTLRNGRTRSCGCLHKETARQQGISNLKHGASKSVSKIGNSQTDYQIWSGIKKRCYNKNCKDYVNYGGRNIGMYKRWKKDFTVFAAYIRTLENCPSTELLLRQGRKGKLTIDRINNDGNYEPGNLRWSTRKQQSNNSRHNKIVRIKGENLTLAKAIEKYAVVCSNTISNRLYTQKWSISDAILTPANKIPLSKRKLIRFRRLKA